MKTNPTNPAEIKSFWGEGDHNDEGDYIGTGYHCEECGESIQEGFAVIIVNDFVMDLTCAEDFVAKIQIEINKYK